MNIVTTYPTVSLNLANPPTESVERDNRARELVQQTIQLQPGHEKRPVASEQEKGLPINQAAQQPVSYDLPDEPDSRNARIEEEDQSRDQRQSSRDGEQERQQQEERRSDEQRRAVEQQQISELKSRDREVRAHEQAHASVGGQYTTSPTFTFERGPDGVSYAIAGQVQIDMSEVPGDLQASINKLETVRAAALAPAEPSSVDRQVATEASRRISQLRADLQTQRTDELRTGLSRAEVENGFSQDPLQPIRTRYFRGPGEQELQSNITQFQPTSPTVQQLIIDEEIRERGERIEDFYARIAEAKTLPTLALSA
jgi:hypothetical protein